MEIRHKLATVLLGPVLVRQGRRVRRHINQLPEPPGDRAGETGSGPDLSVLILGDSAGAGVGVDHQSAALSGQLVKALAPRFRVRWRLEARSGATVAATTRALGQLAPGDWDWVVVSLGANDVVAGRSLARWRADLMALQARLSTACGGPRILFSSLPPMHLFPALPQPLRWYLGARARELDRDLQRWVAGQADCAWLATDFTTDAGLMATDGFHPGPGLYRLWGDAVADHIATAVGGRPLPDVPAGAVRS